MKTVKHKLALGAILFSITAVAMHVHRPYDPWRSDEPLAPAALANQLKTLKPDRHIVYVGSRSLYQGTHIPRALFADPAISQKVLCYFKNAKERFPRRRDHHLLRLLPIRSLPYIRPAYKTLRELGYNNIKILQLNTGLRADWVDRGFSLISRRGKDNWFELICFSPESRSHYSCCFSYEVESGQFIWR